MPLIAPYVPRATTNISAAKLKEPRAALTGSTGIVPQIGSILEEPKAALTGAQAQAGTMGVTITKPVDALSGTSINVGTMAVKIAGPKISASDAAFVTRDSATGNLMLNGQRYRFGGMNAPPIGVTGPPEPSNVYGSTAFADGSYWSSHALIDAFINEITDFAAGTNIVITIYSAVQSVDCIGAVQPTLGNFQPAALEPFDYALSKFAANNIKCIVNFFGNYSEFFTEGDKFWYCSANGVTPDAEATQFYTNTTIKASAKAHISFVLNHVNIYTGIAYKNEPGVLAWGTGGEMNGGTEAQRVAWTDEISQHIKVVESAKQLVIDGFCFIYTGALGGALATDRLALNYVDIYQSHPYGTFVPPRWDEDQGRICHQYGKAFILGEYPWTEIEPNEFTNMAGTLSERLMRGYGCGVVDGTQYWQLLPPLQTWGDGYMSHWPSDDCNEHLTAVDEAERLSQMQHHQLLMAAGDPPSNIRPVGIRKNWAPASATVTRQVTFNESVGGNTVVTWDIKENDVVVLFGSAQGLPNVASAPAGWVNPLGAGVGAVGSNWVLACMYHRITAADVTAGTNTWGVSMFATPATGDTCGIVLRDVDPNNIIDAVASGFNNTASTTQTLPGLSGAQVLDNSLVVSCATSFNTNSYNAPDGWNRIGVSNQFQGMWVGGRGVFTTAGVAVPTTAITSNSSAVFAGITLAFGSPPPFIDSGSPGMSLTNSIDGGSVASPPVDIIDGGAP